MNETHLDIFSGLGGFAVAARQAGFRTVGFCESDSRCREFLKKTWGLPVEPDIRKLDARKYAGISLLTGGPPCQPASRAGKQGGAGDDRWLWDEALRVLEEAKPDCVVFENPPGILDVGIDGILSAMGRLGYETGCFDIPACAVDSPQLRHRIWIIGFLSDAARKRSREVGTESNAKGPVCAGEDSFNLAESNENGRSERQSAESTARHRNSVEPKISGSMADSQCGRRREQLRTNPARESLSSTERRKGASPHGSGFENGDLAHTERERRERRTESETKRTDWPGFTINHWQNAIWVPCADGKLRRAPDDSFSLVDGLHRSLLGALGNSIVPQVAVEILCAIKTVLK